MNNINALFEKKSKNILNIYYTAGFPHLESTLVIASALQKAGADMIEIGIPFSDPLADGVIIQKSSETALKNGMNLQLLFTQLEKLRHKIFIPVILMGYLNPVLQFGMENFLQSCQQVGIDGVILPDLPIEIYQSEYQKLFEKYNLNIIFLITPATSEQRQKQIDKASKGFLYVVSSASTTGTKNEHWQKQENYFQKVQNAGLKNPTLIGFNIKDKQGFTRANRYTNGAIVGSAFIQSLQEQKGKNLEKIALDFVKKIRG